MAARIIKHSRQVRIAGRDYKVNFVKFDGDYSVKVMGAYFSLHISAEANISARGKGKKWEAFNPETQQSVFAATPKAAFLKALKLMFVHNTESYVRPAPKYKFVSIDRVRPAMLKLAARDAGYDEKGKRMMAFICGDDCSDETLAFARNLIAKKWTHVDVTNREAPTLIHIIS